MSLPEIMKKFSTLNQLKNEEKNNVIFKNNKKILKYDKLKIGLINISTLNDISSKRDITKKS